ncbi:MAG: SDR family NAD(P)-dependent oxidoreductase [Betaproteobacteria bacterium]|nr:SDR family NAD(P)-dependent oxidoreductase [Betaproteobacteria bacterium]
MPGTPFDLSGDRALVTGASRGLGRHFALTLARYGADVAVTARSLDALREVAADIVALGRHAFPVVMDVTKAVSVRTAIEQAEDGLGALDVLVNNAGIAITKPALEQTEADWDAVVDTNLKGMFLVATETARRMRSRRTGRIVNIASAIGEVVIGNVMPYLASKAGVLHMTRGMALEWARYGIRVNALAPGYVATDMNRDFFETDAGCAMLKRISMRRLGKPADLEGPLLLLASNASAYMNGSTIRVDGGFGLA